MIEAKKKHRKNKIEKKRGQFVSMKYVHVYQKSLTQIFCNQKKKREKKNLVSFSFYFYRMLIIFNLFNVLNMYLRFYLI
jgi:hypothetical protein